jgi:hypothetical protein
MHCPKCGAANSDAYMFCLGCGHRLDKAPAGEPGAPVAAWPGQQPQPPGRRCAQCGTGRTVQGALGPQLGVRVFTPGRQDDVPLAQAVVCVDCGHVALQLPEDARRYLAGLVGR